MVAAVIGDVVYTFAKGFNSVYILSHFVENFNSIVYLSVSFICLLPDYRKLALTDIVFSYADTGGIFFLGVQQLLNPREQLLIGITLTRE